MALPETNLLRSFVGALYQFQLFENKQKEQWDALQVTGHARTKFLTAPLFQRMQAVPKYSGFTFSHYELPFPAHYYIPYMRSGLYQLVIRVKGIRVCALHCVREVTSLRIAF